MFDPWASLAEMHQPCLYRPIGDRLRDADGLVRREILASLDRLFLAHLEQGRACFQAPAAPARIDPTERFLNISALQKSIRRGDAEGAMRYAQQGCGLNAEQVFRRLATCGVEDVGIGNLLAVAMGLALMGNRALREKGAPGELAAYLAYILASSPKSRLACDLVSIADYDRALMPVKQDLARGSNAKRQLVVLDRARPLAERMAAAWLLAGTSQFAGSAMPASSGNRRDLMRLFADRRLPLLLYYIADRTASRLRDAMFVSWLFVGEALDADPVIGVEQHRLPDQPIIAGYPAAAYDLHTSEGRRALSRFARTCPDVVACLANISPAMRDTAVRHGVFIAEGGRLEDRVSFPAADRVELAAHCVELSYAGITTPGDQAAFITAIVSNSDQLKNLRHGSR